MSILDRHVLWADVYEQQKDFTRLQGGDVNVGPNIFYFSYGNDSYQLDLIKEISHGMKLSSHQSIHCYDATDKAGIQSKIHSLTSSSRSKQQINAAEKQLFILHNVNQLSEADVNTLDLIFPLYEKTASLRGITVLLTASSAHFDCDSTTKTCPNTFPVPSTHHTLASWKELLADHYHHPVGAHFNGNAFISRITRFAIQDPTQPLTFSIGDDGDEDVQAMNEQFCNWLPSLYDTLLPAEDTNAVLPSATSTNDQQDLLLLDSSTVLALCSIVVIVYYILQWIRRQAARSQMYETATSSTTTTIHHHRSTTEQTVAPSPIKVVETVHTETNIVVENAEEVISMTIEKEHVLVEEKTIESETRSVHNEERKVDHVILSTPNKHHTQPSSQQQQVQQPQELQQEQQQEQHVETNEGGHECTADTHQEQPDLTATATEEREIVPESTTAFMTPEVKKKRGRPRKSDVAPIAPSPSSGGGVLTRRQQKLLEQQQQQHK